MNTMFNFGGTQINTVRGNVIVQEFPPELITKLDLILDRLPQKSFKHMEYDPVSIIRPVLAVGQNHLLAVRSNGKVISFGLSEEQHYSVMSWKNIVAVGCTKEDSLGLHSDGTCVASGYDLTGNGEIFAWSDIVSIACGAFHVLGLKSDATVVAFGNNLKNQCEVNSWSDVKAITCSSFHSVGLKNDGSVVAAGDNFFGQCDVGSWQDVIQIAAGHTYTVGLTSSGCILFAGSPGLIDFQKWNDVQCIVSGLNHVAALKKDRTVLNTGMDIHGENDVEKWDHIIAIAAGYNATAGIRADGKIFVTNKKYTDYNASINVSIDNWRLFKSEYLATNTKYYRTLSRIKELLDRINKEIPVCINQDDKFSDIVKHEVYSLGKDIWEMHEECETMPTIKQQIILHSAALADFIEALDKIGPKDAITFKLTDKARASFVIYEKILQQVIVNVEKLLDEAVEQKEDEIFD